MAIILPSQALVLNAYAVLVDETPGNAALKEHLDFISAVSVGSTPAAAAEAGKVAYTNALNSIFANTSTAQLATAMLANLGLTNAWSTAQADAEAYLAASANRVGAMMDLATMLYNYTGTDAVGVAAAAYRADIGTSYAYSMNVANVAGKALVGTDGATGGQTITLTTGLDVLNGTAFADTFLARVVQNTDGHQTNQLGTGDQLHGGAGVDTLSATVQMAAALGSNYMPQQAITPEIDGVEHAYFTALSVSNLDGYYNRYASSATNLLAENETVVINAKRMLGLTEVGSVQSDASVFIENLTTLTDTGVYADRRNTEAVGVRMDHSGNDLAVDAESNLTVLFDNDYLLAGKATSDKAYYFLEDREGAAKNAAKPLARINTDGLKFTVNGVDKVISLTAQQMIDFQANDGTWAGYTALMKAALTAAATTDATLAGLTLELSTTVFRTLGLDGTTLPVPAPAIVLSSAADVIESTGFRNQADAPGQYDVFAVIENNPQAVQGLPITVNVALNKVGRGAEGGALTVGGMATDLLNIWDYSATAKAEGVEKFVLTVEGDATQDSSLSTVRSTNNTLHTVVVNNVAGSAADLYIGNHNTNGANNTYDMSQTPTNNGAAFTITDFSDSMKDVKTFDSSAFANDMSLYAGFTSEMSAKYGKGDLAVTYTTGVGNDTLNLQIGESSSQQIDYHIATGEGKDTINVWVDGDSIDAVTESLAIDAGNGDNKVFVDTGAPGSVSGSAHDYSVDGVALETTDLLKNLNILTGTGTDKVEIKGIGNFDVTVGSGSDMVYVNAGGNKAAGNLWEADGNVNSAGWAFPETAGIALYNAKLSIRVAGFESTVAIQTPTTGAKAFIATTQDINNAIIAAIAANPEIARLVSASIGTTDQDLIVKSLIDGNNMAELIMFQPELVTTAAAATSSRVQINANDVVALEAALVHTGRAIDSAEVVGRVSDGATVTAADVAVYFSSTPSVGINVPQTAAPLVQVAGPFDNTASGTAPLGLQGTFWYAAANDGGTEGTQINNSVINMGSGANDLAVLSSYNGSSNTLVFNATWGKVSVVNFFDTDSTAAAFPNGGADFGLTSTQPGAPMVNGLHQLDFTTFLTNTASTSGSTLSELPIGITVDNFLAGATVADEFASNNIVFVNVDGLEAEATSTAQNLTFAGLTAAQVQAALNAVGGFNALDESAPVPGIGIPNPLVQTVRTSLLFVENVDTQATNTAETVSTNTSTFEEIIAGVNNTSYANYGDYKVFLVTYSDAATDSVTTTPANPGFTVALLGQIDFGNSLELASLQNNLVNGVPVVITGP